MAVESTRQVNVQFLGEGLNENNSFEAADNAASPAQVELKDLASGTTTVTVPSGATACTIIPPAGNTNSITIKGVSGDTGFRLHNTDPSSFALYTSVTSFALAVATTTSGVRLVWS